MPYVAREDVRTTSRRSLSGHRRLKAWERTGGVCVICDRPIDGVRDRWIVEHIRALELGGEDELPNMGPAHEECARDKTRKDHAATAKAKRRKIRHLGAEVIAHPFRTSRSGMLKRKVDGTVVRRDNAKIAHIASYPVARRGRDGCEPSTYQGSNATVEWHDFPRSKSNDPTEGNEAYMASPRGKRSPELRESQVDDGVNADVAGTEVLPALPAHLVFLFEDRPLLRNESAERFDVLQRSIIQELKPQDIVEALWTKDIIVLIWESQRLRQWRNLILEHADLHAAKELFTPSMYNLDPHGALYEDHRGPDKLAAAWVKGKERETNLVKVLLSERGLTAANVRAHGFLMNLPSMERIDRMTQAMDRRRDKLLHDINDKRANFAPRARSVLSSVIDIDSK